MDIFRIPYYLYLIINILIDIYYLHLLSCHIILMCFQKWKQRKPRRGNGNLAVGDNPRKAPTELF